MNTKDHEQIQLAVYMANGMPMEYILHLISTKLLAYKKNKSADNLSDFNGACLFLHLKADIEKYGIEKAIENAKHNINTLHVGRAMKMNLN